MAQLMPSISSSQLYLGEIYYMDLPTYESLVRNWMAHKC
jgi:hypothetical protein